MTLAAGGGDVGVVDRRTAVHAAADVVGAVAIVAGRRDDQPHFEQRLAVDAVGVLAGDRGVAHLVLGGEARIVVALAAGRGKVELEYRRIGILDEHNIVRPVAIDAAAAAEEPRDLLWPWMLCW